MDLLSAVRLGVNVGLLPDLSPAVVSELIKAFEQKTGMAADNSEAVGLLSDPAIREDDIRAGLYDGAEVRSWLVNWTDTSARRLVFRGSLGEIERVGRGAAFVTVDAWRSETERERIEAWALTARTILHVDDWRERFATAGYRGDYFWFVP